MPAAEGQQATAEEECLNDVLNLDPSSDQFPSLTPAQESGLMSPPPRPESLAPRAGNRLSLSLPIQAGERNAAWLTRHAPTDSGPSTKQASPLLDADQKSPNISSSEFLVALAAQERKVLELKEELHRAESQLQKLKRQWALHEADRNTLRSGTENKNVELHKIYPNMPGIDGTTSGEEDDKHIRRSLNIDVDRQKAILAGSTRDCRRKVISGGHTRALSLVQGPYGQTTSMSKLINTTKEHAADGIISPTGSQLPIRINSDKARHLYQDSATTGVKQIAEDIKSGLWTFMEDLRQATVGEEAIKGVSSVNADLTPKRCGKKSSKGTLMPAGQHKGRIPRDEPSASKTRETERRSTSSPIDERDLAGGTETVARLPIAAAERVDIVSSLDDDWSNWDSPISKEESGRWSNSTALSSQDASNGSSPSNDSKSLHSKISLKPTLKRDEATWPALNNFTPSNIKRTASAIIKEWEKSLTIPTPPPPAVPNGRKDPTSGYRNSSKKITDEESRILLNNLP